MLNWLRPHALAETYHDPVSWAILAVDLFPVYAVLQFGWDATALVFLYWLENVIIGAITLLRMLAASLGGGPFGAVGMLFIGPFFIVHYGMFCFVHGIFLAAFSAISQGTDDAPFMSPVSLIRFALDTGAHMAFFAAVIVALQLFLFFRDFIARSEWRESDVMAEMARPYGRVVVLHIALFVGFGAMIALGQPMLGVLGLVALKTLWGMYQAHRRHIQPQLESA